MCTVQYLCIPNTVKNIPTLAHYPEQLNVHGLLNRDSERRHPVVPWSAERAACGISYRDSAPV